MSDTLPNILNVGVPVVESWLVPRDQVYVAQDWGRHDSAGTFLVHPSTMMALKNGGRFPFYTRHSRGVIELERDRRKHGRQGIHTGRRRAAPSDAA